MEKSKPHHSLMRIKELTQQGAMSVVGSATSNAANLGFDRQGIAHILTALMPEDFYKSMTAYYDHTCWHDVYKPKVGERKLYIKLILQNHRLVVTVVSFKEE